MHGETIKTVVLFEIYFGTFNTKYFTFRLYKHGSQVKCLTYLVQKPVGKRPLAKPRLRWEGYTELDPPPPPKKKENSIL